MVVPCVFTATAVQLTKPQVESWQAEAVSFMQMQSKALPKISSVAKKPGMVFKNLQAHLLELEESLAEQQTKVNREVKKQKATYERQMANQDKVNKVQAEKNKIMKRKIARVQESNKDLNKRAHKVQVENDKIVKQLEVLQTNITTAEEYSRKVLNSTDLAMENATALSVLWELDAQDDASKLARKHDKSIDDIAGDEFAESLLQIDSFLQIEAESHSESSLEINAGNVMDNVMEKGTGKLEANEYVSDLSGNLDDLEVEENASFAALKEEFDSNMNKSTTKYSVLVEEHMELNATFWAEKETNKQLQEAVRFTADTHKELEKQMKSLREFAASTADNELASLSFLQIESSTDSSSSPLLDWIDQGLDIVSTASTGSPASIASDAVFQLTEPPN